MLQAPGHVGAEAPVSAAAAMLVFSSMAAATTALVLGVVGERRHRRRSFQVDTYGHECKPLLRPDTLSEV